MDKDTVESVMSRRFRLDSAPTLAAHTTSNIPIAFTHLQCKQDDHGTSGPVPGEASFAFQVMLQPLHSWELWTDKGHTVLPSAKPGDAFLFDLSENPRVGLNTSFDMVRFYISQSSLDTLAYERGERRVGGLHAARYGGQDPVLHGLALALTTSMLHPTDAPASFVEYIALAFHAHAVHTYGGIPEAGRFHGGLVSWQMQRVKDAVEAAPDANHTISRLAHECGLSSSHFARAFKESTGLAPHQWLTQKRVERARTLLAQTKMELTDIALACGFVDQSHFSRVFARIEKQSPGRWRRQLAS